MATFFSTLVLYAGIVLFVSIPTLVLARRKRRAKTARRFLITGGIIALFCALVSALSERLVRQCEEVGNTSCVDYGATGMQFLLIAGYAVASLTAAIGISRD